MPLPLAEQTGLTNTQRSTNGVDNSHYVGTQVEEPRVNYYIAGPYLKRFFHIHKLQKCFKSNVSTTNQVTMHHF